MSQFFKKVESNGATHFVNRQAAYKGVRVLINKNFATIDNLYCSHDEQYVEISEEEFTEAFDKALTNISRNILVAA